MSEVLFYCLSGVLQQAGNNEKIAKLKKKQKLLNLIPSFNAWRNYYLVEKATERDCYNEIPRLYLPSTGTLSSLVP